MISFSYFLFKVLIPLLYIDRDNTQIIMSVCCKGCRTTTYNEEFGKADGTQYNTCITCINKKHKKSDT